VNHFDEAVTYLLAHATHCTIYKYKVIQIYYASLTCCYNNLDILCSS